MKTMGAAVREMVGLLDQTDTGAIQAVFDKADATGGPLFESDTGILECALCENETAVIEQAIGDDTEACAAPEFAAAFALPHNYALPLARRRENPLPRVTTVSIRGFIGEWDSLQ